ncbi:hypothetical protein TNCV_2805041 [Trichonephila clavipes]|nr:hypothetical protein TNCV_2805041 [Trichonephila clavipes]
MADSPEGTRPIPTSGPTRENSMDIPLPASPQASRPGTPQDLATTSPIFQNLRRLATEIKSYSIAIEGTHSLINNLMAQGMTDPEHPTLIDNANFLDKINGFY